MSDEVIIAMITAGGCIITALITALITRSIERRKAKSNFLSSIFSEKGKLFSEIAEYATYFKAYPAVAIPCSLDEQISKALLLCTDKTADRLKKLASLTLSYSKGDCTFAEYSAFLDSCITAMHEELVSQISTELNRF